MNHHEVSSDQTSRRSDVLAGAPLYLRRSDAARYIQQRWGIRCAKQTLAKLAVVGGGPVFRKAGVTPIYAPSDLDTWAQSKIGEPRRSTSDGSTQPRDSWQRMTERDRTSEAGS
jgi:hypothetical protein